MVDSPTNSSRSIQVCADHRHSRSYSRSIGGACPHTQNIKHYITKNKVEVLLQAAILQSSLQASIGHNYLLRFALFFSTSLSPLFLQCKKKGGGAESHMTQSWQNALGISERMHKGAWSIPFALLSMPFCFLAVFQDRVEWVQRALRPLEAKLARQCRQKQ